MKKPQKVNWEERCLSAERACESIRKGRDAAWDELHHRPTKEVLKVIEKTVLPDWVRIMVFGMGVLFLSFAVAMNDRVAKLQEPIIQYKLVEGHTVYRPLHILKPHRRHVKVAEAKPAELDNRTDEEKKDGLPPWDGHSEDESAKTDKDMSGCPAGVVCQQ